MVKKGVKRRKNKKAVSVLVGYVLLVVFAIVISIGVYSWLKSYVPAQTLSCKNGVSLSIRSSSLNTSTNELNVTIRNNGRFGVAGYYIRATNSSNQTLATIDLSNYINTEYPPNQKPIQLGSAILFSATGEDSFMPGSVISHIFDIPYNMGNLYNLEIIPTLYQNDSNNRERFTSCSADKISQPVGEGSECIPQCLGKSCGPNGCGGTCGPGCSTGDTCDVTGHCFNPATCVPASPDTQSSICGSKTCGTALNGTGSTACGYIDCGSYNGGCQTGFVCNSTSQCQNLCGNDFVNTGEQCDLGKLNGLGYGCLGNCSTEGGWQCATNSTGGSVCQPTNVSGQGCTSYCLSLNKGYSNSVCVHAPGQCPGNIESGGNTICYDQVSYLALCCCE